MKLPSNPGLLAPKFRTLVVDVNVFCVVFDLFFPFVRKDVQIVFACEQRKQGKKTW
jgi:hypothetical protein